MVGGHGGYHEFRICNADGIDNPTNECFRTLVGVYGRFQNLTSQFPNSWYSRGDTPTAIIKGRRGYFYKDFRTPPAGRSDYYVNIYKMQLPADLSCKQCIFQVSIFYFNFFLIRNNILYF